MNAGLTATARVAARNFPSPDFYVAAIAAAPGFMAANCDMSAFVAAGLDVIDPWSAAL